MCVRKQQRNFKQLTHEIVEVGRASRGAEDPGDTDVHTPVRRPSAGSVASSWVVVGLFLIRPSTGFSPPRFNLITSLKSLSLNTVTFWGTEP